MRETVDAAMPDTVLITRPSTTTTYDPATFTETPAAPTTIYNGKGRVRTPRTTDLERIFGDTEVTVQRYVGTIPHDVTGVRRDDWLHVTSGTDEAITSRSFRVVSVNAGSNWLNRTLGLEEIDQ